MIQQVKGYITALVAWWRMRPRWWEISIDHGFVLRMDAEVCAAMRDLGKATERVAKAVHRQVRERRNL